jgi:hypothetical protein
MQCKALIQFSTHIHVVVNSAVVYTRLPSDERKGLEVSKWPILENMAFS